MIVSSQDLSNFKLERIVAEPIGTHGYRIILIFTAPGVGFPTLRVHAFRTRGPLAESILVVREVANGYISTVAETEMLRRCKPIVDSVFNDMKKRDRRLDEDEKASLVHRVLNAIFPC